MRPAELHAPAVPRLPAGHRRSRRKTVAAADAVDHAQFGRRGCVRLAIDPGHRAPAMVVVECTSRSVVATTLTCGKRLVTASIMPKKTLGSSLDLAWTSGPWRPRPSWRSSSFPTAHRRSRRCGSSSRRPCLRRLRSSRALREIQVKETTAPTAFAAFMPSMMTSGVVGDSAAKMPPEWNQRTPPAKISPQLKSPGLSNPPASFERL